MGVLFYAQTVYLDGNPDGNPKEERHGENEEEGCAVDDGANLR